MKDMKLRNKLLILVIVAIIPMITLNCFIIASQYKRTVDLELKSSEEYAQAVSVTFLNYLNRIWYAEFSIGKTLATTPSHNPNMMKDYLKACVSEEPTINSYSWVSPEGTIVLSSDDNGIGIDISNREYIKRIINGEEKVVSYLLISKVNGTISLVISRAIRENGRLKGIVVAGVSADKIGLILPEGRTNRTGSFGLVDSQGMIVFKSDVPIIPFEKRQIRNDASALRAIRGEKVKSVNYNVSLDINQRIGVNQPVPGIGWVAFASTASWEILEKPTGNILQSIYIMLITVLLSFFIATYLIKLLLEPINILQKAANAVSSRDFSVRTNLKRRDELGQAGYAFDQMIEHIQELEKSRMLFLQTAAHELRNPMAAVKGIASLIHHKITNGKPVNNLVELVDTLNKEVSRLAALLSQILDAFCAEKQNVEIKANFKIIDVAEVISSAAQLYQLDTTNNSDIINNCSGPIRY